MKTVSFELRGTSVLKGIQCRVTNGRNNVARVSTGFKIEEKFWDAKKQLTRGETAIEKNINTKLRAISTTIENDVVTTILTSEWLRDIIDVASGKINPDDKLLFVNLCDEYINIKEGKLAKNTIESYRSSLKLFKEFISPKRLQVIEIDLVLMDAFEEWLKEVKNCTRNTAIQRTRFILTVSNYCEKEKGLDVSRFRSYKERPTKKSKDEIISLNLEELQKIKELENLPPHLENARKWVLIGTEVGQRASDLLSITPSNIKKDKLRLTQKKTSKNVVVPLASETLELMELFPDKRAVCSLSRNFKTLCLMAGIDSIVLVRRIVDGVETLVEVPKHEAVASHVLRRTFASNLYYSGMPTTLIMSVTKHSTEKQLIDYIGATDEEVADTFQKAREKLKRDEKS